MSETENVKAFSKLYGLLNFYYENRDQPVEQGFDFFDEIKSLCNQLHMDFEEFKKEFHL